MAFLAPSRAMLLALGASLAAAVPVPERQLRKKHGLRLHVDLYRAIDCRLPIRCASILRMFPLGRCKDQRVPRPIVIAIAVIMISLNALVLWELGVKAAAAHATSAIARSLR
jgi:hypothetical protein